MVKERDNSLCSVAGSCNVLKTWVTLLLCASLAPAAAAAAGTIEEHSSSNTSQSEPNGRSVKTFTFYSYGIALSYAMLPTEIDFSF